MTTLSNGRLESFKNNVWNTGLDRTRGDVLRRIGTGTAAAAASFREGQPLMLNSSGLLVAHDGTAVPLAGVASANKMTLGQAVIVDQVVIFTAAGQTRNLRPNIVANSFQARVAANWGAASSDTFAETGAGGVDFVLNRTNGTLQHQSATSDVTPTVASPITLYVSYVVSLTAADYEFEGRNFFNNLDDVTIQDSKVSVIKAPCSVWTAEFDTTSAWAVNAAVYLGIAANNNTGLFSMNSGGSAVLVGRVLQAPTAGDPYVGIELFGTR